MRHPVPLRLAVALAVMALGIVSASAQSGSYRCSDGRNVTVTVDGPTAVSAGPVGDQILHFRRSRGDRSYYTSGEYGLPLDPRQDRIEVEIPDFGTVTCATRGGRDRGSEARPEPQRPGAHFPHEATSWGGSVRAAPDADSRKIGSLREGEPITLLGEADAPFYQDLPWFRIRFRGRTGYQWGGIICPVGEEIPGTFQVCD